MALKKSIVQSNGVSTEYHKINYISLIDRNGEYPDAPKQPLILDVTVISYLNEEYRDACQSIMTRTYSFTTTPEEEESMGIRQLGYTKLKTLDIFEGAENC